MSTTWAVETENLGRAYDEVWALRDLTLQIPTGQHMLVLGPNGSDKSTLLRVLATLVRPTTGTLRLFGLDPLEQGNEARRAIGLMAHRPLLYENLSVAENLRFYSRMYELQPGEERIAALLLLVGLETRAQARVRVLSRGMQQRLALARALLHDPPLLLLDEPDTGLDEEGLAVLEGIIGQRHRTVIMATHQAERGLAWADRVLVLRAGRLNEDKLLRGAQESRPRIASEAR